MQASATLRKSKDLLANAAHNLAALAAAREMCALKLSFVVYLCQRYTTVHSNEVGVD